MLGFAAHLVAFGVFVALSSACSSSKNPEVITGMQCGNMQCSGEEICCENRSCDEICLGKPITPDQMTCVTSCVAVGCFCDAFSENIGVVKLVDANCCEQFVSTIQSGVTGTLTVVPSVNSTEVTITGRISNLAPGKHGFHIHKYGTTSNNCLDAGPHYNPTEMSHGSPLSSTRHVGDLGNIVTPSSTGPTTVSITDSIISLEGIVGRAVVVHEDADDFVTPETGGAGARLSCGVIELCDLNCQKTLSETLKKLEPTYELCLQYETENQSYSSHSGSADNHMISVYYNASGRHHNLEVLETGYVEFHLDEPKLMGTHVFRCAIIYGMQVQLDSFKVTSVSIKAVDGANGWAIKRLLVQEYPESDKYQAWGLGTSMSFWVDGNSDCWSPCCTDKKLCSLQKED